MTSFISRIGMNNSKNVKSNTNMMLKVSQLEMAPAKYHKPQRCLILTIYQNL
jgi:hypothetical protein